MPSPWMQSGPASKALGVTRTSLNDWRKNRPSWWPSNCVKRQGTYWLYHVQKIQEAFPGISSNNGDRSGDGSSARKRRDLADAGIKEIQLLQKKLEFANDSKLLIPRQSCEVALAEIASFIRIMFREMRSVVHQISCESQDQRKSDVEIQRWIDDCARKYQNDLAGRIQFVTESM